MVRGINVVKRHQKQTASDAGRHHRQGDADPHFQHRARRSDDGKPTRVGFRMIEDGRKVRFAKRSGDMIDG